MEIRRDLECRCREAIVAESVLYRSPDRRVAGKLFRIEIQGDKNLSLGAIACTLLVDPIGDRMSYRKPDERRPVMLRFIGQHSVDVSREPISLSFVIDRWT